MTAAPPLFLAAKPNVWRGITSPRTRPMLQTSGPLQNRLERLRQREEARANEPDEPENEDEDNEDENSED